MIVPRSNRTPSAWQPLTPAGVAAFAAVSFRRLAVVALGVLLLVAVSCFWFLGTAWLPVVDRAVERLPEQGSIRAARLFLIEHRFLLLAEDRSLSFALDPRGDTLSESVADVQVTLSDRQVLLCSLLGCVFFPYPHTAEPLPLNRLAVESWWGAWRPAIWCGLVAGGVVIAAAVWLIEASLCFMPFWVITFFKDRDITLGGAWRVTSAAFLPGELLVAAALVAYGLQALDLVQFLALVAAHVLVGWGYLIAAVFWLPLYAPATATVPNPFASATPEEQSLPDNPFALPDLQPESPPPLDESSSESDPTKPGAGAGAGTEDERGHNHNDQR